MSDHESQTNTDSPDSDSTVDAMAAIVLVVLAAAFCLYWVASQGA